MVTDRVGDFIIRLQNAAIVGKKEVTVPFSGHILAIAKKLKQLGFIDEVTTKEDGVKKTVVAMLAYEGSSPKLRGVKRISKPGRRLYVGTQDAHTVKGGTGSRLISTSAGVLSDAEARKNRVGGEELFEIW